MIVYSIMGILSCLLGHLATKDVSTEDGTIETRVSVAGFYAILFLFWPIVFIYVIVEEVKEWKRSGKW